MDTDELSTEAYRGILIEAEKLSHDLTLHYGVLSYKCKNEDEYIEEAEKLTRRFLKAKAYDLDEIFWGNPPPNESVKKTLNIILKNIEMIKSIPIDKRTYYY
jgi:hypothetical protein